MRRIFVVLSLLVAVVSFGPVVAATEQVESPAVAALDEAEESGKAVEIVAERTQTETVYANPSGTFTREIANAPIRVKQDGDWTPVDLNLVETTSGIRPKAAPDPVEFSAGGSDPLVAVDR